MDSEQLFSTIRAKYNTLSDSQKKVADYVLKNAKAVMVSSLNDLATACNVSEPTVIRFLRKIGCDSYQIFRVNIAQTLSSNTESPIYEDVRKNDSFEDVIKKVIHSTAQSILDSEQIISSESVESFVQAINRADRILVIGIGSSSALAFDLCHKFLKLGITASTCHDSHLINIQCNNMNQKDLLIAFSHSGESREILDGVHFAKMSACPIFSVTSYNRSSLALCSDGFILSSSQETKYRSDAMISRIIQLTIIDMIYVNLTLLRGKKGLNSITRSRLAVAQNKT